MNSEKLKQIRESISNTVSCINADSGDLLTNVILNGHLKTLTDIEAVLLGTIHIHEPSDHEYVIGEHVVQAVGIIGGDMNNEKLKPCAFCGGVADFRVRSFCSDRGLSQVKVVCMDCDAESPHGLMSASGFRGDSEYFDAREIAAGLWNSRVE